MVRLLRKLKVLIIVALLLRAPTAVAEPTFDVWDWVVNNVTATTGTITGTNDSAQTATFNFTRIANGIIEATVSGGTHPNIASNGTIVYFMEVDGVFLWVDPAFLTTGLDEAVVGVPAGSCPASDTTFAWLFVSWDKNAASGHAMNNDNQPVAGLLTWTVATNALSLTAMYNLSYTTPSWFTGPISLSSGTCSGGEVTVTGSGDNGGTLFFTSSGVGIYKTNANHVMLLFPQAAIGSKGALKGNFTGQLTRVNNSDPHADRIKPLSGSLDITGTDFIGELIGDPGENSPDQTADGVKMTVDSLINVPSNGFVETTLTRGSNSENALCYVHEATTTMIACTARTPGTPAEPTNLILIEQGESTSISCDSGDVETTCTFSSTDHAVSTGTVEYYNNLTIDGTSGGGLTGTGSISIEVAGNLILQNSAVMSSDTFNSISADTITIDSSSSIQGNILSLKAHDVTINLGGYISADAAGGSGGTSSAAGSGSGGGHYGSNGGAGASHGGTGGYAFLDSGSGAGGGQSQSGYGSKDKPITAGSGGGSGTGASSNGGAGGGTIKMFVHNTLTVNGYISADGADAAGSSVSDGGGGGAGGSVWIQAATFAGQGTVRADGGDGKSISLVQKDGGGGGGGRLSVVADTNSFTGTLQADGGNGVDRAGDGQGGILYLSNIDLCDTGSLSGTCTVSSTVWVNPSEAITGTGNIVIASGGSIQTIRSDDKISIDIDGDLTIESGGSLDADISDFDADQFTIDNGGICNCSLDDADFATRTDIDGTLNGNAIIDAPIIDVSSTGVINANGKGEAGGRYTESDGSGTGGGYHGDSSPNRGGGGGAHAAFGGDASGATGSGAGSGRGSASNYGHLSNSNTKGSGGGAGYWVDGIDASGGAGGGLVMLTATTQILMFGTINANGVDGSGTTSGGGGGAGGAVNLNVSAGSMGGNGTINANGGDGGGSTTGGGGGSGGYILLTCNADSQTITMNVNGGNGGTGASAGTVGGSDTSACNCTGICGGPGPA